MFVDESYNILEWENTVLSEAANPLCSSNVKFSLNFYLMTLTTEKKELNVYLLTELKKFPKTAPPQPCFEMFFLDQFFDVFSAQ